MALSVLIGAFSHLLWDSFTHPHGCAVQLFPVLAAVIHIGTHEVYLYKLLQHGSTLLGFIFIGWMVYRLPEQQSTQAAPIYGYWLIILISVVTTLMLKFLTGLALNAYGNLIVTCISGALIGLIFSSYLGKIKPKNQKYS